VVAVMALQLATALVSRVGHWTLWFVPWWAWLTPLVSEGLLLLPLTIDRWRRRLERLDRKQRTVRLLFTVVSLANLLLLVAVLGSLLSGQEHSGVQLLAKALTVWTANAITFGLWFWSIDRGGPAQRLAEKPPAPDFLFPQLSAPDLAEPRWYPRLFDYLYIAFTNSVAFSPTDTLPHAPGEAADAVRVRGLGGDAPARRGARREHPQLRSASFAVRIIPYICHFAQVFRPNHGARRRGSVSPSVAPMLVLSTP